MYAIDTFTILLVKIISSDIVATKLYRISKYQDDK